ncbi:MarR family winged helix-turn-helix transcriptional regulator [Kineococcus glutinatus]|uniref:MarR family winged helix-turn-helix transcriptional regulator n=1 Tax=Kineococcus glutinatus TaxID=1070872 RepID=UPI0031EB2B7E
MPSTLPTTLPVMPLGPRTGWELPYLVAQAGFAVNAAVDEAARELSMPASDLNALYILIAHGPLPAKALARLLYLQQSSISQLADRLQASGLLRRERDDIDRRRIWLYPTAAAATLVAEVGGQVRDQVMRVFAGLTPGAATALAALLEDVVQPWVQQQMPTATPPDRSSAVSLERTHPRMVEPSPSIDGI